MASRQEEKQRRREERLAREKAQAAASARRKRLQWVFGGVLGTAVIAGVLALVLAGAGGGEGEPSGPRSASTDVKLPEQQTGDLNAAAKAAGCELKHPAIEGRGHDTKNFTAADYKTNPPTSGAHFPQWYEDGIYAPGDVPNLGMLVHTLEHGRIDVQYAPGTPADTVAGLEAFLAEQEDGYHMLLFENTTDMDYAVAATAWGHLLGCSEMNDKVYDALRTFRERYIDQGPEQVA